MYRVSGAFIVLGLTLLYVLCTSTPKTEAHHNVFLPFAGQTWLQSQLRTNQEQRWCVDSRAASYPGFVAQVRETNERYADLVGIRQREVAFTDPSCEVRHLMAPAFPCGSGAAACIYYGNRPVDIHYQENLGFSDWRSAIAHELGHGLLTLHEQYQDTGGITCLYRPETVMSCGPPFTRAPQPLDIERGCQALATRWCGQQPAPPEPLYHSCTQYPGWEGTWSCYWPGFKQWLWEIPIHNRSSLWVWSGDDPVWRCVRGCP